MSATIPHTKVLYFHGLDSSRESKKFNVIDLEKNFVLMSIIAIYPFKVLLIFMIILFKKLHLILLLGTVLAVIGP